MLWKKPKDIARAFVQFYENIFTVSTTSETKDCLEGLEGRVLKAMNAQLLRPFGDEEVDTYLAQMHHLKSPSLDGFSTCFYQKAWSIIRPEVCRAVIEFLNDNIFYDAVNATNIVLITKVRSPTKIIKYQPISLWNVIYKLVAKVLANRMKRF